MVSIMLMKRIINCHLSCISFSSLDHDDEKHKLSSHVVRPCEVRSSFSLFSSLSLSGKINPDD